MYKIILLSILFALSAHAENPNKLNDEKACDENLVKRFAETAKDQSARGLDRMALFDISFPANEIEKKELDCYGILLVSGTTQEQAELPFKAKINQQEPSLLKCIRQPSLAKEIATTVGKYRMSCFYALPLDTIYEKGTLTLDWAKNRTEQELGTLPLPGLKAMKMNCAPKAKANSVKLKAMLKREYCISL
jgi:hypothetical protein